MRRRWLLCLLLIVSVHPALAQSPPDYFLEVEVSNPTPYVGQQVRYSFRLYSRIVNWTSSGLFVEPSYDGFWLEEINQENYGALLDGLSFNVRARNLALYPTRPGPVTIEPVQFVIPDDPNKAGEVLVSDAVTINVQPLPDAGKPERFSGAVGQLELVPTIDRQSTALGEPISLQVTVRGDANMAQLPVPTLPNSTDWRSYASPSRYISDVTDGRIIGETIFSWLLTPLHPGNLSLPEISVSYFDPAASRYRSLTATPITIEVLPGENAANLLPETGTERIALALRPVPETLAQGNMQIPAWSWALWLFAPLATGLIWLRTRRLEHRRRYAAFYRRSEALKQAQSMLTQAEKKPAAIAYRLTWDAVMNYFGDKLNQPPAVLDYDDVETAMQQHGVQPEIAVHVLNSLQRLDQARYAPFEAREARSLSEQVSKILTRVDMVWQ